MANQINIDIGAAANDGTGDPLRTAFNYVNLNFANVWATGLPNSNVQISDNRILTVNTNANLVLAPNGTGKVASNVDIVPNTANAFALGSSTRRWNTVYGQYLDLSHNAIIAGNLTVTGNLSASNISYTSNVFVGDLEGSVFDGASSVVLDVIDSAIYVDNYYYANGVPFGGGGTPGGSNTQVQFNDDGSFGGNVNFVFFKDSGGLQAAGNIFPHANTTGNLGTVGRYWDNLYVSNIFLLNSILATNIITQSLGSDAISANNVTVANITTSQNLYANTGTFYGDQYSDGAIYIGNPAGTVLGSDVVMQITANAGGYSQTNFQNINSGNTASGDYIITADNGNDTTHYIDLGLTSSGWDGSETNVIDGLGPNNGYLYVQDGNLTVGTRSGSTSYPWNFDTTGNLTVPGNIVANKTILIDNRNGDDFSAIELYSLDNILLQGGNSLGGVEGGDINIYGGNGAADPGFGGASSGGDIRIEGGVGGDGNVTPGALGGTIDIIGGQGGAGSLTAAAGWGGGIDITAGSGGGDSGAGGGAGGSIYITAGDSSDVAQDRGSIVLRSGAGGDETSVGGYVQISIPAVGTNPGGQWTFTSLGTVLEPPPNAEIFNPSVGNLTVGTVGNTIIRNIGGFTTYDWVFDDAGNLDAPGNITTTETITAAVVKTTPVTANLLPSAATVGAGARAFITDADVAIFGNLVVGGGIYYVPVFSNGSSWYIG